MSGSGPIAIELSISQSVWSQSHGNSLLNKTRASAVMELNFPLAGRLTTSLKGFYALAAWECEPTSSSSSSTQVVQHSKKINSRL